MRKVTDWKIKKQSVRFRLLTTIAAIYAVVLVLFSICYALVANVVMAINISYTVNSANAIKSSVNDYYSEVGDMLTYIATNEATQNFLHSTDKYYDYQMSKKMDVLCSNFNYTKKYLSDIVIYSHTNKKYYSATGFYNLMQIQKYSELYDAQIFQNAEFVKSQYTWDNNLSGLIYYTSLKSLQEGDDYGEVEGVIAALVNKRQIQEELERHSYHTKNNFYVMDKNKKVIYGNTPDLSDERKRAIQEGVEAADISSQKPTTVKFENEEVLAYAVPLELIGCKLVAAQPYDHIFADLQRIKDAFMIAFAIAGVILLFPALWLLRSIVTPISKLMVFMRQMGSDKMHYLEKRIEPEGCLEFREMSKQFNEMLEELNALTTNLLQSNQQLYAMELEKERAQLEGKMAELNFLRSQINPHFLYNTLETIKGVALCENAPMVFDMVKSLAVIFKYSVKGSRFVTTSNELKIVSAYAKIQQIRFGGKINFVFQIEENAMEVLIPKMILQPIVENAFQHGLEQKEGGGTVWISAKVVDKALQLIVEDNGCGMEKGILSQIQAQLEDSRSNCQHTSESHSIGLQNVNRRIKLLFGENGKMEMKSEFGKGTCVMLSVPVGAQPNMEP